MTDRNQMRRSVMKALEPPDVAAALGHLVERGCDRDVLLRLFERLRRAEIVRIRAKKSLKKLTRRLERAASGVADLVQWSESGKLGLPDDPETWLLSCSHDLKLLADAVHVCSSALDTKRTDPNLCHARQQLQQHVETRTNDSCDEHVAVVMAAVLGWTTYNVGQHVEWRTATDDKAVMET